MLPSTTTIGSRVGSSAASASRQRAQERGDQQVDGQHGGREAAQLRRLHVLDPVDRHRDLAGERPPASRARQHRRGLALARCATKSLALAERRARAPRSRGAACERSTLIHGRSTDSSSSESSSRISAVAAGGSSGARSKAGIVVVEQAVGARDEVDDARRPRHPSSRSSELWSASTAASGVRVVERRRPRGSVRRSSSVFSCPRWSCEEADRARALAAVAPRFEPVGVDAQQGAPAGAEDQHRERADARGSARRALRDPRDPLEHRAPARVGAGAPARRRGAQSTSAAAAARR